MNHTSKTHTFAILGAVLALAIMPALVDSAYAETTDELVSKIQKLEEKITSIQDRSDNLDLAEKKLISKYQQKVIQYESLIEKVEQKQKTQKFMKSEVQRLDAEEKFQEIHRQVYVENDKDRGISTDDTLLDALNVVVESEDFALVSAGLDKMINQYRDVEVRSQLQEYKVLVMDAMQELDAVNNQNTEVLALTSGDVEIQVDGTGFGEENEIFNPEIIKTQLKQQIKTAVTNTKQLADKISEEHKQSYQTSNALAKILADKKPKVVEETDDSDKPKYQTKGVLNAIAKLSSANDNAKAAVDKVNTAKGKVTDAQSTLNSAQAAVDSAEPDSKEYKNAVKALNKAQKKLDKAESNVVKAQTTADKKAQQATAAEEKVEAAKEKVRQDAIKKAQKAAAKAAKAALSAQKATDAATKAADKASTAQQKADDLATKAADAATAAEGADPDSKEAKNAQKAANKAQKAADAAQKAADSADKKQDNADTKKQQSSDAQQASDDAAANVC